MKFTLSWLKDYLDTKLNEDKIIDKLTDIGLEVESFKNQETDRRNNSVFNNFHSLDLSNKI